jgi:hypothetical protein
LDETWTWKVVVAGTEVAELAWYVEAAAAVVEPE